MAITKGLSIVCDDMQRTGGVSQIFLRTWATGDVVTFTNTAGTAHCNIKYSRHWRSDS